MTMYQDAVALLPGFLALATSVASTTLPIALRPRCAGR